MTFELWVLFASIVLGFLHIILQAHGSNQDRGFQWNLGPRDDNPPLSANSGRLARALVNYLETYPFFVAALLLALAVRAEGSLTQLGAALYLGGRIVYLPLYAYGVSYARTAAWNVATLGIILILVAIVIAARA
jgi:uncharacterized MAPEG superfamily protein